jgi:hypothetical protein
MKCISSIFHSENLFSHLEEMTVSYLHCAYQSNPKYDIYKIIMVEKHVFHNFYASIYKVNFNARFV